MGYVNQQPVPGCVGTSSHCSSVPCAAMRWLSTRFEIKYVNPRVRRVPAGHLIPGETLTVPSSARNQRHGPVQQHLRRHPACVTTTTGIFMYRQHYMSLPLSLSRGRIFIIDGALRENLLNIMHCPGLQYHHHALTISASCGAGTTTSLPLLVLSDQKKYDPDCHQELHRQHWRGLEFDPGGIRFYPSCPSSSSSLSAGNTLSAVFRRRRQGLISSCANRCPPANRRAFFKEVYEIRLPRPRLRLLCCTGTRQSFS